MLVLDDLVLQRGEFSLAADWSLEEGRRLALIGPSGAGKSTLLDAIAGFLAPLRGRILWRGQDITALPPAARPMTILFQDHNLLPHLDVFANVAIGLDPRLKLTDEERRKVRAVLARVGLAGLENRRPEALSGGQRSRVALARALARERPLLLLDEPFAALGPALRAEMLDLVNETAAESGATVLLVTHQPEDARRLGDLASVVAEGRAAPPMPVERLLAAPPAALARYLGTGGG